MKVKKIVIILSSIIYLFSPSTAFAAGLSSGEEALLEKLKAGVEVNGMVKQLPIEFMNQIENELMKNDTDISLEKAEYLSDRMDEVIAIVQAENLTTVNDIKESINEILPIIVETAKAVGYLVEYDAVQSEVSVTDLEGNTVFTNKEVINQTGSDLTVLVITGSLIVFLLTACILVANKRNLFVKVIENRSN
ncbi:MAG: hypothetical protein ACYDEX_24605 [Mobilitalea sp.]